MKENFFFKIKQLKMYINLPKDLEMWKNMANNCVYEIIDYPSQGMVQLPQITKMKIRQSNFYLGLSANKIE